MGCGQQAKAEDCHRCQVQGPGWKDKSNGVQLLSGCISHRRRYVIFAHASSVSLTASPLPACTDGAVHLWQTHSNFVRPHRTVEGAHAKGSETGSLTFSLDGHTVMTRGGPGDDTLKRKFHYIEPGRRASYIESQFGTLGHSRNRSQSEKAYLLCILAQMRLLARMIAML